MGTSPPPVPCQALSYTHIYEYPLDPLILTRQAVIPSYRWHMEGKQAWGSHVPKPHGQRVCVTLTQSSLTLALHSPWHSQH